MKFLIKIILIAALSYVAETYYPWWSVVVCAFLVSLILPSRGISAFLDGFLGVGLLWLIYAWMIDLETAGILSEKIAVLLKVNQPFLVVVLSGITGAFAGGFGALSGSHFRLIFTTTKKKRSQQKYYMD